MKSLTGGKGPYEWVKTGDGTWSLSMTNDQGVSETMHHRGGALAESRFIYQSALDTVFEWAAEPRVLSVGLGLGYNELLAVESAYKRDKLTLDAPRTVCGPFQMVSFEKEKSLVESFLSELQTYCADPISGELHDMTLKTSEAPRAERTGQKASLYHEIFSQFALPVCLTLLSLFRSGQWQIRGELNPQSYVGLGPQDLILWDAFSPKMSGELWGTDFLVEFTQAVAAPNAILVTYACNRSLKESLIRAGFEVTRKRGFSNKKHSTWAVFKA